MNVSEVLNKAADLIEEKGWVQEAFSNRYGYCAIGAIRECIWGKDVPSNSPELWDGAIERLVKTVREAHIPSWNDAEGRTKEEVIAKLREAANS